MSFIPLEVVLKNNARVQIRAAEPDDATLLIQAIQTYITDSDYLLLTEGEFHPTVEQERSWIRSFEQSTNSILLIAMHENKIIGNIDLTGSPRKRLQHTAVVGMGMLKEWRNTGLGNALLTTAIKWAIENPVLEHLWLQVFHNNEAGLALYRKCGFKEQGRQKDFIKKEDGEYADNIIMGLQLSAL